MNALQTQTYWRVVEQSLCELWGFSAAKARSEIRDFKNQVARLQISNAVYHDEPYHTACTIAGDNGDYENNWKKYLAIRDEIVERSSNVVDIKSARSKKLSNRLYKGAKGNAVVEKKASKAIAKPAKKAAAKPKAKQPKSSAAKPKSAAAKPTKRTNKNGSKEKLS